MAYISICICVDEHVVSQWFHHEGKLVGWDATVAGALASMFAQFLTTPVSFAFYFLHFSLVFMV